MGAVEVRPVELCAHATGARFRRRPTLYKPLDELFDQRCAVFYTFFAARTQMRDRRPKGVGSNLLGSLLWRGVRVQYKPSRISIGLMEIL